MESGIAEMLAHISSGQEHLREEQRAQGQILVSILDALNPKCHVATHPRPLARTSSQSEEGGSSRQTTPECTNSAATTSWPLGSMDTGAPPSPARMRGVRSRKRLSGIGSMVQELTRSRRATSTFEIPNRESVWEFAKETLFGKRLDNIIGFFIFVNCICIGAEIQQSLEGSDHVGFQVLEHFFLCIYLFEAAAKVFNLGMRGYLANRWHLFDFVLVCVGVLGMWVVQPITNAQGAEQEDTMHGKFLENVMILRILRLLRLFRVFRLVHFFQDLWKLVNGLMQSAGAIVSTFFLLTISIYVFACIGVELITQNKTLMKDPELSLIVEQHFSSLYVTMVTLCRFVALDSTAVIYEPLVWRFPSLLLYFCSIAMVVSIALMNLVTAILVDAAINQSNDDKELSHSRLRTKVKKLLPMLEDMFDEIDVNDDERISANDVHEFSSGDHTLNSFGLAGFKAQLPRDLKAAFSEMSLIEIFENIDSQNAGFLDKQEFVEGVLNIVLSDAPVIMTKVLHQIEVIRLSVQRLDRRQSGSSGLRKVSSSARLGQVCPGLRGAIMPLSLPCSVEVS